MLRVCICCVEYHIAALTVDEGDVNKLTSPDAKKRAKKHPLREEVACEELQLDKDRRGGDIVRQELCKELHSLVLNGEISPLEIGELPPFDESMSCEEIENTYRIHQQPFVKIDVEKLEIFEYFRCLRSESEEYQQLVRSFEVCC